MYEIPIRAKSTEIKGRLVATRGREDEEWGENAYWGQGFILEWWKCFETRGTGCTTLSVVLNANDCSL